MLNDSVHKGHTDHFPKWFVLSLAQMAEMTLWNERNSTYWGGGLNKFNKPHSKVPEWEKEKERTRMREREREVAYSELSYEN